MEWIPLACAIATIAAGSFLKGAMGFGLPLIAMPVLSVLFGVPHAICVVAIPMAITNIWQIWQFRHAASTARFLPRFLIAGGVGIAIGTWLLASIPTEFLALLLGLIVVVYLALRFISPEFRVSPENGVRYGAPVGLVTGVFHGATGFSGPVGLTFMSALRMEREVYIFCVAAMFLSFSALQIPLLVLNGIMTEERFLYGALSMIGVFIGMPLGAALGRRLSARAFEILVLALLALSAIPLLWEGLGAIVAR